MTQGLPDTTTIVRDIKQMLVTDLQLRLALEEISDTCSLLEDGLNLDSILIAELIACIEGRYGLEFDERVLETTLFGNLTALATFVAGEWRTAKAGAPETQPGEALC
jgi:acyl carrier protein